MEVVQPTMAQLGSILGCTPFFLIETMSNLDDVLKGAFIEQEQQQ